MQNPPIHEDTDIFGHGYTGPDMLDPDSILHKNGINRSNITLNNKSLVKKNRIYTSIYSTLCKHNELINLAIRSASGN